MGNQNPEPDPNTDPTPDPEPDTLSGDELRAIVGEEIDSRLSALDLDGKLSRLDVLDGIEDRLTGVLSQRSSNTDNRSLLTQIDKLIDDKIANLGGSSGGSTNARKPGPLGRFLSGNPS